MFLKKLRFGNDSSISKYVRTAACKVLPSYTTRGFTFPRKQGYGNERVFALLDSTAEKIFLYLYVFIFIKFFICSISKIRVCKLIANY